jgi:hypothetical protein
MSFLTVGAGPKGQTLKRFTWGASPSSSESIVASDLGQIFKRRVGGEASRRRIQRYQLKARIMTLDYSAERFRIIQ